MNRKFFNLLLMGALAVTAIGSVSSCKDYDDDINNLQEQIEKAALKTEVEALRTTLTNVQANAQSALEKANANETEIAAVRATAEQAATDVVTALANAAAAQASADEVAAKVRVIYDELDGRLERIEADYITSTKLKDALDDLEQKIITEQIDPIKRTLEIYKAGINTLYAAVTGVELVGSYTAQGFIAGRESDFIVEITCGTVGNCDDAYYREFGKAEKAEDWSEANKHVYSANSTVEYVYGTQFSYADGQLLVRVNPTNANVTKDMIKFFDSWGNDLDDVIEVASVEKFDGLLTTDTRGKGNATGLWMVSLKSKKDVEKTNGAVKSKENNPDTAEKILYALGVNNTAASTEFENAADRYVVSSYDVSFTAEEYTACTSLDNVEVKEASKGKDAWKKLSTQSNLSDGTHILTVNNGENFQVRFAKDDADNAEYFFVVRDDYAAGNSGSSEYNAWKNYKYGGDLGEMIAVKNGEGIATLNVTIPSSQQTGDEIQFRVYAVNYDGSLVRDGKGKAFRVYVGTDLTQSAITADLKAVGHETMKTDIIALGTTLSDNGTDIHEGVETIKLKANGKDVTVKAAFFKDAKGKNAATKNSEIKYVQFTVTSNLTEWKDGAEATGTLVNYKSDDANLALNTISLKLTKVMPTVEYTRSNMGYSWKDGQLVNGVYTAYLFPSDAANPAWTTDLTAASDDNNQGQLNLNGVFNGLGKNFGDEDGHTHLFFANSALLEGNDGKEYYTGYGGTYSSSSFLLNVSNVKAPGDNELLIDGETKHETVIGYDYGEISSEWNVYPWAPNYPVHELFVTVETFQTVYACPLSKNVQTYAFQNRTVEVEGLNGEVTGTKDLDVKVLKFGNTTPVNLGESENLGDYLLATNSRYPGMLSGKFHDSTTGVATKYVKREAKFVSVNGGNEDYFTVKVDANGAFTFTAVENALSPAADIPSKLILTLTDAFGHKYKYEFTGFVVKP